MWTSYKVVDVNCVVLIERGQQLPDDSQAFDVVLLVGGKNGEHRGLVHDKGKPVIGMGKEAQF
jgi:hypothetical protein